MIADQEVDAGDEIALRLVDRARVGGQQLVELALGVAYAAQRQTTSPLPALLPDAPIVWHERGDPTFKPFARDDHERLRRGFVLAERIEVLDR